MRTRSAKALGALALLAALLAATFAQAEIGQVGSIRVAFKGEIRPSALPRDKEVPVMVSVGGQIGTVDGSEPPPLRTIRLAINKNGHIDYKGLPKCRYRDIQPTNNREALEACKSSLVGEGHFSAKVLLPEQSPFPSKGKVLAFNGEVLDHPVIFAHIYGTEPVPTSFVLPFVVRHTNGNYATTLVAYLPKVGVKWGFVTGVSLHLHRLFKRHGKPHSYLSAACGAPKGFPGASFSFAKAEFAFAEETTVTVPLTRSCKVAGA
jgi:hypothetical protein